MTCLPDASSRPCRLGPTLWTLVLCRVPFLSLLTTTRASTRTAGTTTSYFAPTAGRLK
ncbi:hypothetical protein PF008_g33557 [Phytophthora fragariae]|uniref:RxLR effector protein n=1 Tax=Phytophthora fragariae TaxID=53985 RepID=A0A6G0PWN1_9STRA|nr:hypothetical protein PF008_g33557 [Phytophthora fragariae]